MDLIRILNSQDAQFEQKLDELLHWSEDVQDQVESAVKEILARVQNEGDSSLVELTAKFDNFPVEDPSQLIVGEQELDRAWESIPDQQREALQVAANRIAQYHEKQSQDSWQYTEADGTVLGQKITPLDSVGLYVPGGKAAYPSSVLMAAIPAKVAGVKNIVMVTPTPSGEINPTVLAAAKVAGVNKIFRIGGAQAVAALAYGTETVPKVDKIVGPGNIYVATAKRAVFGLVDIDMIAGPSEILVVSDGSANPDWVAMDLCSQAEHDENAQAILLSTSEEFTQAVHASLKRLVPELSRSDITQASLKGRGALITVSGIEQAIEFVNRIAPEHLELAVDEPEKLVPEIRHAGAIFMGHYTSEALGDYCAGPNHVLPTSGTARFSSPLGVYDFQKRSSIIHCSRDGASKLGKVASVLARSESLEAHALSAEYRVKD